MHLIKDDRQLKITRDLMNGLIATVEKLRARHKGAARRLFTAGPLGMIEQLKGEIREYLWLKKATPEQVMRRYKLVAMSDVGPFLARLRIASRLTQAELARRVGCQQPDIARIEDADYQAHSASTLKAIAEALGVEIVLGARRPKRVG